VVFFSLSSRPCPRIKGLRKEETWEKKHKKKKRLSAPHHDYAVDAMEERCYRGNSNQGHPSS
jgi:hypothetical protein